MAAWEPPRKQIGVLVQILKIREDLVYFATIPLHARCFSFCAEPFSRSLYLVSDLSLIVLLVRLVCFFFC